MEEPAHLIDVAAPGPAPRAVLERAEGRLPMVSRIEELRPVLITSLGCLYEADCMDVLPTLDRDSVDTVFADPPFNLNKHYGRRSSDDRDDSTYIEWCQGWLRECVRVLKPAGSLFVYNLPRWNIHLGAYLSNSGLDFRHWIAIEHKSSLPIPGRLYPAHYSLLYFSKGKPLRFQRFARPSKPVATAVAGSGTMVAIEVP